MSSFQWLTTSVQSFVIVRQDVVENGGWGVFVSLLHDHADRSCSQEGGRWYDADPIYPAQSADSSKQALRLHLGLGNEGACARVQAPAVPAFLPNLRPHAWRGASMDPYLPQHGAFLQRRSFRLNFFPESVR